MLSDWVSVAFPLVGILVLCTPSKIPYGKPMDHAGGLDQDGKPALNQWVVRQTKRNYLLRLAVWMIAVGGVLAPVLSKLGL